MTYLTDDEMRWGAGQQVREWHGASAHNCRSAVGHYEDNRTAETPRDLAEAGGLLTTIPIYAEGGC